MSTLYTVFFRVHFFFVQCTFECNCQNAGLKCKQMVLLLLLKIAHGLLCVLTNFIIYCIFPFNEAEPLKVIHRLNVFPMNRLISIKTLNMFANETPFFLFGSFEQFIFNLAKNNNVSEKSSFDVQKIDWHIILIGVSRTMSMKDIQHESTTNIRHIWKVTCIYYCVISKCSWRNCAQSRRNLRKKGPKFKIKTELNEKHAIGKHTVRLWEKCDYI